MKPKQRLRVLLGSMKHTTAGKHSAFMPVAIGFIAAFAQKEIGPENIEFKLEERPEEFLALIENWRPNIIGVSNYCWNAGLNYLALERAKATIDGVVCIAGGPEFHEDAEECREMLAMHPEIDFFAYGEGEIAFTEVARQVLAGAKAPDLKKVPQVGLMAIHPETGALIKGERPVRGKEMDHIPSPYLTGIMDHFFDGDHAPMVQLARGCPYACTFCNAAQSWYNRVAAFSMERVKAELDYIARKTKDHPNLPLAITDSNFGMFQRDVDIGHHIRALQDKYGWPVAFDFTTGKAHHDRILHVNDLIRNSAHILLALQSMNTKTLDVIKRKNLSKEKFAELHQQIKERGMMSATDLIVPLPEETKKSFFEGLKMVTDAGVDLIVSNTLCLLKGTALNSRDARRDFSMRTKWRLVPRQFGTYGGRKVFDMEEVCIATNTMSFEDYLECRGLGGIAIIFSDPQFDVVHRHVRELGLSKFDLIKRIWKRVVGGDSPISGLYDAFIRQSESELFDSEASAIEFYSRPENYERLKTGEVGDNLIRRLRGEIFITKAVPALNLAYDCLEEEAAERLSAEQIAALKAARTWATRVRDVSAIFGAERVAVESDMIDLPFDVQKWYAANSESLPLVSFRRDIRYHLDLDQKSIQKIMDAGYRMYGRDKTLTVPRILEYYEIGRFWLRCVEAGQAPRQAAE